jgi:hypothetical protein
MFDAFYGEIVDPWTRALPTVSEINRQWVEPKMRPGAFFNERLRQGAAVFWRTIDDDPSDLSPSGQPNWHRDRRYLRTFVHELAHVLNLSHPEDHDSLSFMNYPTHFGSGTSNSARAQDYWAKFLYQFDAEELFHLRHGFYHEVMPGGEVGFKWFSDPTDIQSRVDGRRFRLRRQGPSLRVNLAPGKDRYRFTEPVTLGVSMTNVSDRPILVPEASPAYGQIRYFVRKPAGNVVEYRAPVVKETERSRFLDPQGSTAYVTGVAVGAGGVTFDQPGRYEIRAVYRDPVLGEVLWSDVASLWVRAPSKQEEWIADRFFDWQTALFYYFAGGYHLNKGMGNLEEITAYEPLQKHPFVAHANLVLGLNALGGQKSVLRKRSRPPKRKKALKHLRRALESGRLPDVLVPRLEATLGVEREQAGHWALCRPEDAG